MALKLDRHEETTDISHYYNQGVATRGGVVVLDATNASGVAMDQAANKVRYKLGTASDKPVGILLNDVVNKDLTRTHLNWYKDEVQLGSKVTVLTRGWVVTSNITGTPSPGDPAYVDNAGTAGNITNVVDPTMSGNLFIGTFLTNKDADGYAKVAVNLPNYG